MVICTSGWHSKVSLVRTSMDYACYHAQRRSMSMYEPPIHKRSSTLPSLASIDAKKSYHFDNQVHSAPIPIPSLRPANHTLPKLHSLSPSYFGNIQHRASSYMSTASTSSYAEPVALPKLRSMSLGDYIPSSDRQETQAPSPMAHHSSSYEADPIFSIRMQHHQQHEIEPEVMRFNHVSPQSSAGSKRHLWFHTGHHSSSDFTNRSIHAMTNGLRCPEIPLSRSWSQQAATPPDDLQSCPIRCASPQAMTRPVWRKSFSPPSSDISEDDDQPDEESDPSKGVRVCRSKSCKNVARSKGLCRSHGGGKRCTEPGCTKSAQANKKCIAHGGGTPCSYENCEKTAQSRGLCKAHGGGARCKFPSCPKSSQSRGFCRGHGGGVRCKAHGCQKWVQRNGFCIKHGREQH
jgi:hypothetical protein